MVSSKNDDIVYQQYELINNNSGAPQYSIANTPNSSLPYQNQYRKQAGNYFNIFNYDQDRDIARPITVSGEIAFQATSASGSASINFDTQINLDDDLLLGYNGSGKIDINSNAGLTWGKFVSSIFSKSAFSNSGIISNNFFTLSLR